MMSYYLILPNIEMCLISKLVSPPRVGEKKIRPPVWVSDPGAPLGEGRLLVTSTVPSVSHFEQERGGGNGNMIWGHISGVWLGGRGRRCAESPCCVNSSLHLVFQVRNRWQ